MDLSDRFTSRMWFVRVVVIVLILSLLAPAAISAVTYEETDLQSGTITQPANGSTVVGIQGFHFENKGSEKKPARAVSIGPRGGLEWEHLGGERGATWVYDVDPLENGNILVVSTKPGKTDVYEFDPETREPVWTEEFDIEDTHDVEMISEDELLVANMRNEDPENGTNGDRLFIYNRTEGEITWEWRFADHYPEDGGGDYADDWTHVNDVEMITDDLILASPRNFDQAIVVNRSTDEIEMRLGEDGNYDILREQHNPDWLESEDGTPTVLVADSENDRIVEYELVGCDGETDAGLPDCEWELVWEFGDEETLNWPRDADRLPNGNTLVTDTLNHRVIEVTPQGEIVWEFYATWGPYDAERVEHGGGSNGPTMADMGVSGSYLPSGSAGLQPGTGDQVSFSAQVSSTFVGTPIEDQARWFAQTWSHVTPWIRPVWMTGWDFFGVVLALFVGLAWLVGETVYNRHRIRRRVDGIAGRPGD